jgi:hypothetical protein
MQGEGGLGPSQLLACLWRGLTTGSLRAGFGQTLNPLSSSKELNTNHMPFCGLANLLCILNWVLGVKLQLPVRLKLVVRVENGTQIPKSALLEVLTIRYDLVEFQAAKRPSLVLWNIFMRPGLWWDYSEVRGPLSLTCSMYKIQPFFWLAIHSQKDILKIESAKIMSFSRFSIKFQILR